MSSTTININKLNCEKETKIKYQKNLKGLLTSVNMMKWKAPEITGKKTKEAIDTAASKSARKIGRTEQVKKNSR